MRFSKKELANKLSVLIYCPQDKSFLLVLDEGRGDYWIPFDDINDNLSWNANLQEFERKLFDFDITEEKLLKIYKIWTLKKEFVHLLFQINVPKDIKANCKTQTSIGIIGWFSCSEITNLRPSLRSLEVLEVTQLYKPLERRGLEKVTGEPLPIGSLTEVGETDILVNTDNCDNQCYLDLLESAGFSPTAQHDIYEEYFCYTFPCIYMNSVSFCYAMQKYCFSGNLQKLFHAADVWNRDFLTFQDFLFLIAVIDPFSSHYGCLGEIRCQYIFRYYNESQNGRLNLSEFKDLISDIEKKKNPRITEKQLEKLTESTAKSLDFKPSTKMTFEQFYNHVIQFKIRDTSLLLRLNQSFYNMNSKLESCGSVEQIQPLEILLPFKSSPCICLGHTANYSIVLKTTLLRPEEAPCTLRDIDLLEDAMTKSVLEDFNLLENSEYLKQESADLDDKINELFCALKFFSTEIRQPRQCTGEGDCEDKEAYSWGSMKIDKIAIIFILMCERMKEILSEEPRLLQIEPPVFVMGDLHGNFHDLMCFENTVWKNGIPLTPAKLLFLGDYVDRGLHSAELLMYLFASKIQNPDKLYLIRGNHEMRDIQKLFTFQRECINTFGETLGMAFWKSSNEVFDVMPLAGIIDRKVFCCHGGIPPPWLCPIVSVINSIPTPLANCEKQSPLAWTLMWNDPLKTRYSRNSSLQMELVTNEGFLPNLQRGTGFCFTCSALEKFLLTNDLSHVIRAHESVKAGFQVHQKGKLLTVFSSSNYCGGKNYAGTVLVADNLLRVCMVDTGKKKIMRNTIS